MSEQLEPCPIHRCPAAFGDCGDDCQCVAVGCGQAGCPLGQTDWHCPDRDTDATGDAALEWNERVRTWMAAQTDQPGCGLVVIREGMGYQPPAGWRIVLVQHNTSKRIIKLWLKPTTL